MVPTKPAWGLSLWPALSLNCLMYCTAMSALVGEKVPSIVRPMLKNCAYADRARIFWGGKTMLSAQVLDMSAWSCPAAIVQCD